MYEIEVAAQKIHKLLIEQHLSTFSVSDFGNNREANGFVELVYHEWMTKPSPPYNGCFTPTVAFWKRIGVNPTEVD